MKRLGVRRFLPTRTIRRDAGWWLTALGMVAAFCMLAAGGVVVARARTESWGEAERASQNLARTLEADVSRTVELLDLSLHGAADAAVNPELNSLPPALRQAALFDSAAADSFIGSLMILDDKGNVREDSRNIPPRQMNFADRAFFTVHQHDPHNGLFVSRTFPSQSRTGVLQIALSRRIDNPDGSFGGVVMGTLNLEYFNDLFAHLRLGPNGVVTVLRTDGRVLTRYPFRESDIDFDLAGSTAWSRYAHAQDGRFVQRSAVDNVERLYTFKHVSGVPLVLSVGIAVDDMYGSWHRRSLEIGLVLVLLCVTTLTLSLLIRRELRARQQLERRLMHDATTLAAQASNDGLTGLANRRQFDSVLQREWRRMNRTGGSMALLLLDVDHFKKYNDQYGHQEGDAVLRTVARCIQDSILRPADLGARYGGEEFALILPDTDLNGARLAGERIRAALQVYALPHTGSVHGQVTISVGACAARPNEDPEYEPETLLKNADLALYEAKGRGRNQLAALSADGTPPLDQIDQTQDAAA